MIETLLRSYLGLYWLRPETALWRTADALAIHAAGITFAAPLLDLACGDGLNSYVLIGGGTPPLSLDAFVATSSPSREEFLSGRVDLYDRVGELSIAVPAPPRRITVGLDQKAGLLGKASALGLYDGLVHHDANGPLPFAAESFACVFSNALYSISNLSGVLAETARVLRPAGRLVALLTGENFRHYAVYRLYERFGWEWCRVVDRGRHKEVEHCYGEDAWRASFEAAGLEIARWQPHLSSRLYQIAEVGLRPVSPVLIKLANAVSADVRLGLKREWIDYCMEVALPMFTSGWLTNGTTPQIYYLVEAVKRA